MAMTNPASPRSERDDVSSTTRAVADDMAAIFGSEVRAPDHTPSGRRVASGRPYRRRPLIVAVAAGALAATVAAGVFAGRSAIGDPAVPSAARISFRPRRPAKPPELAPVPSATATATTPSPSLDTVAKATPAFARQTAPEPVIAPSATKLLAVPRAASPPSVEFPVRQRPSLAAVVGPAPPSAAIPRRTGCDEDTGECFASRFETAEQRLDDAYERADAAGVRPGILRGYQREWDRARDEAAEQPRSALHLYAMITSDLYNLADDAEARDDAAVR